MDETEDQRAAALNAAVRDALLTHIRQQKAPWEKLKQKEQQDIIYAVENTAREVIRYAVATVAARGFDYLPMTLKDLNIKDGRIKGKFEATMTGENVQLLAEHENQRALVVLAEAADFMQGADAKADPDEPEIPLDDDDDDDQRRSSRLPATTAPAV